MNDYWLGFCSAYILILLWKGFKAWCAFVASIQPEEDEFILHPDR